MIKVRSHDARLANVTLSSDRHSSEGRPADNPMIVTGSPIGEDSDLLGPRLVHRTELGKCLVPIKSQEASWRVRERRKKKSGDERQENEMWRYGLIKVFHTQW